MIQYLQINSVNPHRPRFDSFKEVRAPSDLQALSQWEIKKFAGKLKLICSILTGIPVEDFERQSVKDSELGEEWTTFINLNEVIKKGTGRRPLTVRELLQRMGTDAMRDQVHPNIHVNALFADYNPIPRTLDISDKSRLRSIWRNIQTRCTNPNHERWEHYGGKGIINEFTSLVEFGKWAESSGYTDELQIDRKDPSKNYTPDNCRWVTIDLQAFNKGVYKSSFLNTKGVSIKKARSVTEKTRYIAQIQVKGNKVHIGNFDTEQEARDAYQVYYQSILEVLEEESKSKLYKSVYPHWVISDVRYPNEAQAIKDRDGIVIRVNRSMPIDSDGFKKVIPHASETSLDSWPFDAVVENNGTMEDLLVKVQDTLKQFNII